MNTNRCDGRKTNGKCDERKEKTTESDERMRKIQFVWNCTMHMFCSFAIFLQQQEPNEKR